MTLGQTVSGIDNIFNSELDQTPYTSNTKLPNTENLDVKNYKSAVVPQSPRVEEMPRKEMNFQKQVSWPEMQNVPTSPDVRDFSIE